MILKKWFCASFQKIIDFRLDYLKSLPSASFPSSEITIHHDSKEIKGYSYKTTPLEISKSLKISPLAAKVKYFSPSITSPISPDDDAVSLLDYDIYDLTRPLEGDCEISFISFEDFIGKQIFWHSSSHILGYALEQLKEGLLLSGPSTQAGFYYDIDTKCPITPQDLEKLSVLAEKIIDSKFPFIRFVLSKTQALELFSYNPYKLKFITNKIPENGKTTVYQIGQFVDLCAGPHVINTNMIKSLKLTENSAVS